MKSVINLVQSPGLMMTKSGASPPAKVVVWVRYGMKAVRLRMAPADDFRVDFQKLLPAVERLMPP